LPAGLDRPTPDLPVRQAIDGLRIALHLSAKLTFECEADLPVVPHLMAPDLARRHGVPARTSKWPNVPQGHPWRPLADYLEGTNVRHYGGNATANLNFLAPCVGHLRLNHAMSIILGGASEKCIEGSGS
jgi:hypothetical protein